jgi:steroid 5-alpha reductase family enzyme
MSGWFGSKSTTAEVADKFSGTSGAEQDRYGSHLSGKAPSASNVADNVADRFSGTSGAEQDRYGSHFSGKAPSASKIADKVADKFSGTSGAEQDRYGSHMSDKLPSASGLADKLPQPQGSGAEQDRFGNWFGGKDIPVEKVTGRLPRTSGAEQDRYGSHFGTNPTNPVNATAVGLLQHAVLPSFTFHAGLSLVGYGVSRYTNRVEGKDWLWPTGMAANAWWSAIGTRVVYDGLTVPEAWSTLNYPQKLVLAGASAWGARLFYRIATRSVKRGKDDPRYEAAKTEPGFWNKALFTMFLPEAVAQTLISLPFILPFRAPVQSAIASPILGDAGILHGLSVFLFSAGFAMEVLADSQLESHKKKSPGTLNREGVWSIVRHPNYLGDALIHASFPILLLGSGLMHPFVVAGPLINYVFLRFVGGDGQNEAYQEETYSKNDPVKAAEFDEYRQDKNSFWPSLNELQNKWSWAVIAVGAGAVVVEQTFRSISR